MGDGRRGTRNYTVTYDVDYLPEGSADGAESYKQVTITVAWTGNPKPIKPVVLSTMVSKQYAGPQIVRFEVGPDNVLREETSGGWSIISGPVVLDAYLSPEDILSMDQDAAEEDRGYVEFYDYSDDRYHRKGLADGHRPRGLHGRGKGPLHLPVGQLRG